MSVKAQIEEILTKKLNPQILEVEDQSDRHVGHSGHDGRGESHFHIYAVSAKFTGKSRIERQRMVNDALKDLLKTRIHALSMSLNDHT